MNSRIEIIRRLYRNRVASKTAGLQTEFPIKYRSFEKELKREGIVVIPGFWDTEKIDEVRLAMERIVDSFSMDFWIQVANDCKDLKRGWGSFIEPHNIKVWCDENLSDQRLFYSENVNQEIKEFGEIVDFIKIAECLTLRRSQLKTTLFNRTKFVKGNKGSGGGWHRDGIYSHGFKSLMYLTDVNEDNGPFQYIPRSFHWLHHLRYASKVDQYQYSQAEIDTLLLKTTSVKIKTVTGKRGDLVIFNTNGIHRGKPIESGVRCAITNYFT